MIRFLDEIAARSANQRCQLRKEPQRQRAQLIIKTGLHARSYTDVARQGGHIHCSSDVMLIDRKRRIKGEMGLIRRIPQTTQTEDCLES